MDTSTASDGQVGKRRLQAQPVWALLALAIMLIALVVASVQAPYPNPLLPWSERSAWSLLRDPIEINAAQRLQAAPARMLSVTVLEDGQRGWAVGDGGTILVSRDGGQTWTAQASSTQASLWSLQFNPDGQRGWAVGHGGTIVATRNGGQTWTAQNSRSRAYLFSVHFNPDGQRGWAVGDNGTILATRDGGQTWAAQNSRTQAYLYSVQFNPDGQRGWASGSGGTVLATRDGGQTWTTQKSSTQAALQSVHFNPDGQRGWAVGDSSTILATRDGGKTWTPQTSSITTNLYSVQFNPDGQRGWAGGYGGLLATRDGGQTWVEQKNSTEATLQSFHFNPDGQRGWAVGDRGTILVTRNGGQTWATRTSSTQADLKSVQFNPDGLRGWAVGGAGVILATRDRGRTWTAQASNTQATLWSVQFSPDGQRGWAVGEEGTILATSDGGLTWAAQTSGVQATLWSVQFNSDGRRGWAVGGSGTILATHDGGLTWAAQTSNSQAGLQSAQFSPDGERGWVVGTDATLLATRDGGQTWTAQPTSTLAHLYSVQFNPDGQRGWLVGDSGTILTTRDGGRNWTAQASGTLADLMSVQFSPDGQRGWAVGDGGTLLTTHDGGRSWRQITSAKVGSVRRAVWVGNGSAQEVWAVGYPPALLHSSDGGANWQVEPWPLRYSRYPAPWFWLALVGAALCWHRALRLNAEDGGSGAAATGTTDAPTKDFSQDRLRFGPLAIGISRFLRNQASEPPLTLAISGDWGSGKSSLMNLVCTDLRRHGCRPVWFNAWHHQKDEQLLAALLNAVKDQALPPSWTPDGWTFRLRLLWLRSKQHFAFVFVLLLVIAALAAFLVAHDNQAWDKLWALIGQGLPDGAAKTGTGLSQLSGADIGKLIAPLASGLAAIMAMSKALTAFGTDPAVLLAATAEQFRFKDASALTNFRARFATQFGEVTLALPYRMVIVIDDLDRCRAEAVLDVMEAVNFLVSSGDCIVMFGMATQRVQAALSLSFDKIAAEMVELAIKPGEVPTAEIKEQRDRERRRSYARDYLEKLINLEICVPVMDTQQPHELFESAQDGEHAASRRVLLTLLRLWPLLLAAVAISLGWHAGRSWQFSNAAPAAVLQTGLLAAPAASAASDALATPPLIASKGARRTSTTASIPASATASKVPLEYAVPTVQPGDERDVATYVFATPIALLLTWAAGLTMFRLRGQLREVRDSSAFHDALKTWTPLVRRQRTTPRALKRFVNRVRYLAMLQQPHRLDESRGDALRKAWQSLTSKGSDKEATANAAATQPVALGEDMIVALGALYEFLGADWRQGALGTLPDTANEIIAPFVERHLASPDAHWPPTADELQRFEDSLKGIRIPA